MKLSASLVISLVLTGLSLTLGTGLLGSGSWEYKLIAAAIQVATVLGYHLLTPASPASSTPAPGTPAS